MDLCLFEPEVPKEDMDRKPVGGSKMEKDILARTMEQLRRGVVQKQVVSGREFKGRPFNSKPEVIHFKVSLEGWTGKQACCHSLMLSVSTMGNPEKSSALGLVCRTELTA